MITQNVMLDFLSRAPKVSKDLKLETNQKSDQFAFKNTFERESQRAQLKERSYGSDRNSYHHRLKENSVKRENVNSYRDIVRKNTNSIKNDSVDDKCINKECKSEVNDIEKEEKVKTSKDEAVVQVLSEIFGIQPTEFKKLLEEINIDPQELADETKMSEICGKIAIKIGLDTAQTESLEEILKETILKIQQELKESNSSLIRTTIDKAIPSQTELEDNEPLMAQSSEMVTKGNTVEEVKTNTELISKLKMRIDELTKSLNNDPKSVENEISNIIKIMMGNEKQLKQSVNQTDEATTNETQMLSETVKNEKTVSIDQNAQKNNRYDKNSKNEVNKEANSELQNGSNMSTSNKSENTNSFTGSDTNSANNSGNGNNLEQKNELLGKQKVNTNEKGFNEIDTSITINNSEQNNISKTVGSEIIRHHREVPAGKREILNQIIEKASILQNSEKTEMVLSLKPESLGKLSLKIVTEQGIVTAKFVAESQQVKEVLESNMQLLKDTLEKQGLAVQSFSVSVNQNPEREFTGRGYQGDDQKSGNTGNKILDTKKAGVIEAEESINKVNPYNYGESSINLTA